MNPRLLCTFQVDELTVGVDIARVREVLRTSPVTPVPLSEPCVAGLLNLRGQIVTVVDMRARLGLGASGSTSGAVHVVVESRGELLGLVVDREGDVVAVGDDALDDTSEVVENEHGTCFVGTSNPDDCLILILDPDRVLSGLAS
jgi:purine-binding chemotaxis protein CheW